MSGEAHAENGIGIHHGQKLWHPATRLTGSTGTNVVGGVRLRDCPRRMGAAPGTTLPLPLLLRHYYTPTRPPYSG
jgi:hypothetical protein